MRTADQDASSQEHNQPGIFLFIINKMKVIYNNEGQYKMPRILLVICVTINIDDTLSDPLNALKICAHGIFVILTRKASFMVYGI